MSSVVDGVVVDFVRGRYSRKTAAAWFSVSESHFRNHIEPHLGKPLRDVPGGKVFFTLAQLQSYVMGQQRAQLPSARLEELMAARSQRRARA